MKVKIKNYLLQYKNNNIRIMAILTLAILVSACASAIIVEQQIPRENDDRTELQIQLDTEISNKINAKFKNSKIVRDTALHISTYKHVVTINGFVGNKEQKSTALRLALSVSGVKSVISDIGIRKY
jgi:osmotically-inducible protein OsmY